MANVFDFLKPKASLSRNGFDLSQRHIYSQKVGQRLPVLAIDCIPNDYHEIDLVSMVRTMPVSTDAFVGMKVHFEFGFVPYWQMWHDWNDFILQTHEPFSNRAGANFPTEVPKVNLAALLRELISSYVGTISSSNYDMFYVKKCYNALRILDLLGYGSYYWLLDALSENMDDVDSYIDIVEENYSDVYINVFRIFAYQKFCQDYGRSTQYELLQPVYFNMDDFSSLNDAQKASRVFQALGELRYALWKKDMFTGLMSSPQFGAVSSVDLGSFQLYAQNAPTSSTPLYVRPNSSPYKGEVIFNTSPYNTADFTSSATIDVLSLRKAEMFQKWKEDKLRAGNKLKDQAIAMWGQPFRYQMDNYSRYIGEVIVDLNINEVVNTSAQGNVALGEIAGKGIGTGNGKIKFDTDDFGVLLCVAYVLPTQEYDAVGLDKNNTLVEAFDFATPAFENLGFEGIYNYQLSVNPELSDGFIINNNLNIRATRGYAPRYLNYKTAINKVHGEFQSIDRFNVSGDVVRGSLSHWSAPRTALDNSKLPSQLTTRVLHVSPHSLDTIFVQSATESQKSDHFLFNTNFIINSVRSLSVLGLPRW